MTNDDTHPIKGDRALGSGDEDKLGFREVAKRIAMSLVDRASEDGLVVGVEGSWGSGKSSLLFLIEDELGRLPKPQRPTVISFRPWLIGNRDALIAGLFGELARELEQVANNDVDATWVSTAKAKEAVVALRSFMGALGQFGSAIEVAGDASGIGPVKYLGKFVKVGGELFTKKPAAPQLSVLKDKLVNSLRELGHRFVITVDDVDRLEPQEVLEVLRLVRSVVDLPNVIYLLCYDEKTLAHSIQTAAMVESGQSYLEKIVQMTVMVPAPEPFKLRQWFTDDLNLIASAKNEDELTRLKLVIDSEGGRQLRTPRAVVRTLDAIRFLWPQMRNIGADLADLVWLEFIKDGNPSLYRWIEDYCAIAALVSLGVARADDADKSKALDDLNASVPDGYFEDLLYRYHFAEQLAGVEPDHDENGKGFKVYEIVGTGERERAIVAKRLASPDHYRLYFALAAPSFALTQKDFASIWTAAEIGAEETSSALLELHSRHAAGSLTKVDLLIERIGSNTLERLTPKQCENLVVAFSLMLDTAFRRAPFDPFWVNSLWDRAQRLLTPMLSRISNTRRGLVIKSMFGEGRAIGWLTSLFRRETFAHGRFGDDARPEPDWLFTDPELDTITKLMLDRYRKMTADEVLDSPQPVSLLFAWLQGGDKNGPRRLVETEIASDEGLVKTLERFTSMVDTSDRGRVQVLKENNLSSFMNYETAKSRISKLREHGQLGARASRLHLMLETSEGV